MVRKLDPIKRDIDVDINDLFREALLTPQPSRDEVADIDIFRGRLCTGFDYLEFLRENFKVHFTTVKAPRPPWVPPWRLSVCEASQSA